MKKFLSALIVFGFVFALSLDAMDVDVSAEGTSGWQDGSDEDTIEDASEEDVVEDLSRCPRVKAFCDKLLSYCRCPNVLKVLGSKIKNRFNRKGVDAEVETTQVTEQEKVSLLQKVKNCGGKIKRMSGNVLHFCFKTKKGLLLTGLVVTTIFGTFVLSVDLGFISDICIGSHCVAEYSNMALAAVWGTITSGAVWTWSNLQEFGYGQNDTNPGHTDL